MKKFTKRLVTLALTIAMLATSVMGVSAANVTDFFDAKYYASQNPDVAAAFGNNEQLLLQHYLTYGINEGRNGSNAFDVRLYKQMYKDLDAAFGNNWAAYLNHYLAFGINEKRDGGGEFDIVAYMENNPDVVAALGTDFAALKNHYNTVGKTEGRVTVSAAQQDKRDAAQGIKHSSSKSSSSSSSSSTSTVVKPSINIDALSETLAGCFYETLTHYVDYAEDFAFDDYECTIAEYNCLYREFLRLEGIFNQNANAEYKEMWAEYKAEYFEETGVEDLDYLNSYILNDGKYYDMLKYQTALKCWYDNMPDYDAYLSQTDYAADYEEWENSEPTIDDCVFGYKTQDAADAAYAADHADWEANKPVQEDYIDEETYEADLAEYTEENPEPQPTDDIYKCILGGYTTDELARAAFESAMADYTASEPDGDDFVNEDEYNSAVSNWEATEPDENAYMYYDNTYGSQDEADGAYNTAHANWEADLAEALEGLTEADPGYEEAYNNFIASNPEPDRKAYEYHENTYPTQEAATEAYNNAYTIWNAGQPNRSSFINEEEYNAAVEEWEAAVPVEQDFLDKVAPYTNQEEATAAYEADHAEWEASAPQRSDYADEEAFEEALSEFEELYPEPQPTDECYGLGDGVSQPELEASLNQKIQDWNDDQPNPDTYLEENTTYFEDYDAYIKESAEPSIDDFEVDESEVTDEPAFEEPALG